MKNKKSFLICSLAGRIENLMNLISTLKDYTDWHLYLSLQKYPSNEVAIIKEHCNRLFPERYEIIVSKEMTGPHLARCAVFDKFNSDIWCILDDDMWAVNGYTDYDAMAEIIAKNKNIGFLSGNWRKTETQVSKVECNDKLIKQNIVYTGGGMLFRADVAEIIKNIPRVQYVFDNPLWSIYAYINGYDNYRWLGSVAVHQICTKGGRRKWLKECDKSKSLPPSEWIKTRRGTGGKGSFDEFLICDSSDITELAHKLHEEAKNERYQYMNNGV